MKTGEVMNDMEELLQEVARSMMPNDPRGMFHVLCNHGLLRLLEIGQEAYDNGYMPLWVRQEWDAAKAAMKEKLHHNANIAATERRAEQPSASQFDAREATESLALAWYRGEIAIRTALKRAYAAGKREGQHG